MLASKVRLQTIIAISAVVIFIIKIIAWYLTRSLAIYTDAIESLVNVVAGFLGLYSVWLAAQPKDKNHPYGHGKVEYLSSAIEGTLIIIAGAIIIYQAIDRLFKPSAVSDLPTGILLIALTALMNGALGYYAVRYGKKHHSIALESSGKHLLSDTYSTIGILVGLAALSLTNWVALDAIIASAMGIIIIYSGYTVMRKSLAGIMDEADLKLLEEIIQFTDNERKPDWIDLHNLRVIQYGNVIHIDAHMTVPWYYDVIKSHDTVTSLEKSVKIKYKNKVEFFIHTDACTEMSCALCSIENCRVRQRPFQHSIPWTLENVLENKQHKL